MSHIEPDDLVTLALDGEQPDHAAQAHLDECAECRAEYDALVRTIHLGREGGEPELEAPPSRVWSAIHGELGLAPELTADPLSAPPNASALAETPFPAVTRGPEVPRVPEATRPREATRVPEATPEATRPREATRPPGATRPREATRPPGSARPAGSRPPGSRPPRRADTRARRRWWPVALAAASVGVLVGLALGVGLSGIGSGGERNQTVLASATLDAFPGWSTGGTAVLEEDGDGMRTIVVDLDDDVAEGELREVWLIRADASGLLSLGFLEGTSGRFAVPAGVDLDEFRLVDVSAEPVDGDPSHSGDSIVRGELRRA